MSLREEQCKKVCRILDDVLANRPTERDSLIVAVRKAFESLEQFGNSEPLPPAQPESDPGRWERHYSRPGVYADLYWHCSKCGYKTDYQYANVYHHYCPNCGADMRGEQDE